MSKIVKEYKRLKNKDSNKLYLFKVGTFYIFIADDAEYINNYMVLKKTKFTNDYIKCGFPCSKIDDYKRVFNNLHLNVEIIDEVKDSDILNILNVDIDNLSKEEAISILKEIKLYYE